MGEASASVGEPGAFSNSCRKMEQDRALEKGQQECVCVFVGRCGVGHKASLGNEKVGKRGSSGHSPCSGSPQYSGCSCGVEARAWVLVFCHPPEM